MSRGELSSWATSRERFRRLAVIPGASSACVGMVVLITSHVSWFAVVAIPAVPVLIAVVFVVTIRLTDSTSTDWFALTPATTPGRFASRARDESASASTIYGRLTMTSTGLEWRGRSRGRRATLRWPFADIKRWNVVPVGALVPGGYLTLTTTDDLTWDFFLYHSIAVTRLLDAQVH